MTARDNLLAMVRDYPGLHQRELARQLGVAVNLVQHHVKALVDEGHIYTQDVAGTRRYYPAGVASDRAQISSLRDRSRLHIVMLLLQHGPMRHNRLVETTGMGKSTLSFHLAKLTAAKMVVQGDGAYRLVDPDATRRLLETNVPTPDLLDRFGSVWDDLYGP